MQNQQKIAVYHHIARCVVVLRPGRPEVRIPSGAPRACDKKDVAGFFFAVSSKIGSFTTQFWDAVLQCCQTILGRFPQLDAHFPCRFLEFGRRRGNFFEKNRINPAVFRMFSISSQPISHWLRGFSVFCSCWQNGNCPHFHSVPHYANVWRVLKSDIFYAKTANF